MDNEITSTRIEYMTRRLTGLFEVTFFRICLELFGLLVSWIFRKLLRSGGGSLRMDLNGRCVDAVPRIPIVQNFVSSIPDVEFLRIFQITKLFPLQWHRYRSTNTSSQAVWRYDALT